MPKRLIAPDENGMLVIGDLSTIHKDAIAALTTPANLLENVSGSSVNLFGDRFEVLLPVSGTDKLARYTVALTVTREPVTEQENTAILTKKSASETRKADEKAKQDRLVTDAIAMANAHAEQRVRDVKDMAVANNDTTAATMAKLVAPLLQQSAKVV